MCQISLENLGNSELNRKLFLLAGTLGSDVHNDGWGFANYKGEIQKSALPMRWTSNAGFCLDKMFHKDDRILLGHIRQASVQVPVCVENSHPFSIDGITMVHNGKLTPKKESDFVTEVEVEDLDKEGKKQYTKEGQLKMKKVKRSDTLIFFEKFMEFWKADIKEGDVLETSFVTVLNKTMELFTGKFAFVFIIQGTFFVVRGKTADLHIAYLKKSADKDSPYIGWAINTSRDVLDTSCVLLSNLNQISGKPSLNFTYPVLLPEESVFVAQNDGLKKIGIIKENPNPTVTYYHGKDWDMQSGEYFTTKGAGKKPSNLEKLFSQVSAFMSSHSMTDVDIHNILYEQYGASSEEITEHMLKHFCNNVLPALAKKTEKKLRKRMRKALGNLPLRLYQYDKDFMYPWMLNSKEAQLKFIENLEKKQDEAFDAAAPTGG